MDYDPIGGCGRRVHAAFVPAQLDPPKPKRSILVSSYPLCLYLSRIALPPGPLVDSSLACCLNTYLAWDAPHNTLYLSSTHGPCLPSPYVVSFLSHGERRRLASTVGLAILRRDVPTNVRWSLAVSDATATLSLWLLLFLRGGWAPWSGRLMALHTFAEAVFSSGTLTCSAAPDPLVGEPGLGLAGTLDSQRYPSILSRP